MNIEARIKALESKLSQCFRVGEVTNIYPGKGTVRVRFSGMVSYELPVLTPKTQDDKFFLIPDIGEQVLAVFLPSGLEQGFVVGAFFSGPDSVPVSDPDKHHIKYSDGTILEYDRKAHKLTGTVKGDIDLHADNNATITAQNITATAGQKAEITGGASVDITAPVINLTGNLSSLGSGGGTGTETKSADTTQTGSYTLNGNLQVNGNINATGDILDGGSNSNHHAH